MPPTLDPQTLRANPRFLVRELIARGVEVHQLDAVNDVLEARYGDHRELLVDIDSSLMPYAASVVASSKTVTRRLLEQAGVSVPEGECFASVDVLGVADYVRRLDGPVVVKPALGNQGELVYVGMQSVEEALLALNVIAERRGNCEVIVEREVRGAEYRVFYTKAGRYAVLHRDPAAVIGDGLHSIEALAEQESSRRMNPRINCLCPILLDDEADRCIRRAGLTRKSVPARGEKVYVRFNSNVKTGGICEDVTDQIDPSVCEIARRTLLAIPGLPYAGIDLMTEDIRRPLRPADYAVLEVNSLPGIGMHMAPGRGPSRNVAALIVDLMFPETAQQLLSQAA